MNYCVITTINNPTEAIRRFHETFGENLIVVGDRKTPDDWECGNAKFISIPDQRQLEFAVRYYIPDNHYSKKNIGYLAAMKRGANCIYDTDDDNIPNVNWKLRSEQVMVNLSKEEGWFNVFNLLSPEFIWPRGFSLKHVHNYPKILDKRFRSSPIQQGLSDGEPDVDAIWRLILKKQNKFPGVKSVYLERNTWCPFNSQSTWWFPKAFALMYLPVYASFRMSDIWRSFVAQRCLWELGLGVTFHSPSEVYQDRNPHDLMEDFRDEVSGYLNNDRIVEILSELELKEGEDNVCYNMIQCYSAICEEGILHTEELSAVKAWVTDYGKIIRDIQQA